MTYLVAARRLDPRVKVANAPYVANPVESVAGFEAGDRITVRALLYGLMLPSGNDAAATLSLRASGSTPEFVQKMNAAAARLDLTATTFVDPVGLDSGNVSSPQDLADLTRELREQQLFRRIVASPKKDVRSGGESLKLQNRNQLVRSTDFVDGVKTGATLDAGFVLVASARRRGIELVSVVTGAPSEEARDDVTLELLDFGFSLYRERSVVPPGERIGSVRLATGGRLPIEAATRVRAVVREDQEAEVRIAGIDPVTGPIAAGTPVARGSVLVDGRKVGRVEGLAARAVSASPDPGQEPSGLPGWAVATLAGAAIVGLGLGGLAIAKARGTGR